MNELQQDIDNTMSRLLDAIKAEASRRDKNASGETANSLRYNVLGSDLFISAQGYAANNWRFWGNGRGPGAMPPVSRIERWLQARGGDTSKAWAVAKGIAKSGTKDFQQKQPNVVTNVIERYRRDGQFDFTDSAADYVQRVTVTELKKLEKVA